MGALRKTHVPTWVRTLMCLAAAVALLVAVSGAVLGSHITQGMILTVSIVYWRIASFAFRD